MASLIAILFTLSSFVQSVCPNPSYICTDCTKPYSLNSFECVATCPEGSVLTNLDCVIPTTSILLFNEDLSQSVNFTSNTIGNFITPAVSFNTISSPVPTKERGFYFYTSTYLFLNTNPVPAPSLTLFLWIRVLTSGTLIKIVGSSDFLVVAGQLSLNIDYRMCRDTNDCSLYPNAAVFSDVGSTILWVYFKVLIKVIVEGEINFVLCSNYNCASPQTMIGENALVEEKEIFTWSIGDSQDGFEGFVYWVAGYNNIHNNDLVFVNPPICNPFEYYENSKCYPCADTCDLTPLWCVRGIDCSLCINNFCSGCSAYTNNACPLTTNPCALSCTKCSSNMVIQACLPDYLILNKKSSGWACSPVISFILTTSILDLFIQSGSNPSTTYGQNPDADDPWVYPCRGYHFSPGKYLVLNPNSVFSSNMILYMWVFPVSGTIANKGTLISIGTTGSYFTLKSRDGLNTAQISYGSAVSGIWQYLAFKLEYLGFITSMTVYQNGIKSPIQSSYGYFYQDSIDDKFYLGTEFTGFLALVGIASYKLDPSYTNPTVKLNYKSYCGASFNPCDIDSSCSSCDVCADNSVSPVSCYSCPYGYYSSGSTQATLTNNGKIVVDGISYSDRGNCMSSAKGIDCISCKNGYVLYKTICISVCPSTFNNVSGKCTATTYNSLAISTQFSNIIILSNYSGFDIGNNNTNSYPEFDSNDPIPALNRGYYFNSTAYMSHSSIILGPEINVGFWINFINFGEIFSKPINASVDAINFKFGTGNSLRFSVSTEFGSGYVTFGYIDGLNSWSYVMILTSYDTIEYHTSLKICSNWYYSATNIPNNFIEDQIGRPSIIGSKKSLGFTGFIYMVEVYNDPGFWASLYSGTCTIGVRCPSSSIILTICTIQEYWNGVACNPCGSCGNGCIRNTDCNLCGDVLCEKCSSFSGVCEKCTGNSTLINNVCQCFPGASQTTFGTCVYCDVSCGSCNGKLNTDCLTCSSGYLWFVDYTRCLKALQCPTLPYGMSNSVPGCSVSALRIFYAILNQLTDSFVDSANGMLITTGVDSKFYTNYALTDPRVSHERGFYFTGSSYLSIDPYGNALFLAPEFTMAIWALVVKGGTMLIRKDNSVVVMISTRNAFMAELRSSTGTTEKAGPLDFTLKDWHLFEIQVSLLNSHSILTIILDSNFISTVNLDSQFQDSINSVITYIGSDQGNGGFIGFVYSIEIYNSVVNILTSNDGCLKPADAPGCLSTCLIDEYPPHCFKCRSDCKNGCLGPITCSICDDPLCEVCNPLNNCTSCIIGAVKTEEGCKCLTSFNQTSHSCEPPIVCYVNCGKCVNNTMSGCLKCSDGYHMVSGYCMLCPTGFLNSSSGSCSVPGGLVFDVEFNTLDGIVYDKVNKIPVITGNSEQFYPEFDSEDPYPSYLRGFYFNGISSSINLPSYKSWTSPVLTLAPTFTIQTWIKPQSSSGCILSSTSLNGTLLSFCYSPSTYVIQANIDPLGLTTTVFPYSVPINFWQVLILSLDNLKSNTLYIHINNNLAVSSILNGAVYINYMHATTFAFGKLNNTYFEGFIYQILIFNSIETISRSLQVINCPSVGNLCLVDCSIHEYWIGPSYNDCGQCNSICAFGCRRNDSCTLCEDPLCSKCSDYKSNVCKHCTENAFGYYKCKCLQPTALDYTTSLCVVCEPNQFYNNITCENCKGLCTTCTSEKCLTCRENSKISGNTCECLPGLHGTTECTPAFFNFSLTIGDNNAVIINFDENLVNEFLSSQLSIDTTCGVSLTYRLEKWSASRFMIDLSIQDEIPNNCVMRVCIKDFSEFVSSFNRTLRYGCQAGSLKPTVSVENEKLTNQTEKTATTVIASSTSATVAFSMINPNPACLWSFVNAVQMLCFISLSSTEQPPRFKGYLKGLKKYNAFPNLFEYFVPHYGGQKPFQRAYEFGYIDNLVIFNLGNYISAFISMLFIWLFTYLLSKLTNIRPFSIGFIKNQIISTLQNYKYGAFIRFWITCYLDVFSASVIAVLTLPLLIWTSILNFAIAACLNSIVVATPFVFFYFSFRHKQKIAEEPEVSANWGTLFYEFNNDKGLGSSQFYFYFFIRRVLYILIQIFLQGIPTIQLCCNICLSLSNLTYLLVARPFGETILNISNPLAETGIFLIFLLLTVNLLKLDAEIHSNIDVILVWIINAIMAVQMAASLAIFLKTVFIIIKKKCAKKIVPAPIQTNPTEKDLGIHIKAFRKSIL